MLIDSCSTGDFDWRNTISFETTKAVINSLPKYIERSIIQSITTFEVVFCSSSLASAELNREYTITHKVARW